MGMIAEIAREAMKNVIIKLIKDKIRAYKRRRKGPERAAVIKALEELKEEVEKEPIL